MAKAPGLTDSSIDFSLSPPSNTKPLSSFPSRALSRFISHLVFEAPAARIGVEITVCIIVFSILRSLFSWQVLISSNDWQGLVPWFLSCGLITFLDYWLVVRPLRLYQKSSQLELRGAYEQAMKLLSKLNPAGYSFVSCPAPLYHWRKSRILIHAKRFEEAETELRIAMDKGLETIHFYLGRAYLFRTQNHLEFAKREIELAEEVMGQHPAIYLERGMLLFSEKRDFQEIRKIMKTVMKLPAVPYLTPSAHFGWGQGLSTMDIASAFHEVSRLWTGEAEEGIIGVNVAIEKLQACSQFFDDLRPVAALVLLERAYYFATHQEPKAAAVDLRVASRLCMFPEIELGIKRVQDELEWRHAVRC